jgi:hypothetical protein
MSCDTLVTASHSVELSPPVPDLIDARHRQPGRLGELLTGDARLEALAVQTAQLGVGGVECVLPAFAPRLESLEPTDDLVERLN